MAEYAGYLRQRVNARQSTETDDTSGITASTAWAYYDNVSAFLDHCLKWDKITENPAQKEISKDELPERPSAKAATSSSGRRPSGGRCSITSTGWPLRPSTRKALARSSNSETRRWCMSSPSRAHAGARY